MRARDGELSVDELSGGTFTITNGGLYGSLMSTPIINPAPVGHFGHAQNYGSRHGGERSGGGVAR
jgi:pyruvate/2-oxoglutarate dehydrogenase complex dihydrolipoamide acyltransferase (E2) component